MRNRTHMVHGDILRKTLFMGLLLLLTLLFILPGTAVHGAAVAPDSYLTIASSVDGADDSSTDGKTDSSTDAMTDSGTDSTAGSMASSVEFVIGSMTYMGGGTSAMMDVAPFIEGARTYVPVRYLAQGLGVAANDIGWNPVTQEVTLRKGTTTLTMMIGSMDLRVNGISQPMDTAPLIRNGRTFLPARYVSEALGYTVTWNEMAQKLTITSAAPMPPTTPPASEETADFDIEIRDGSFTPETLTIQKGDSVTWTNEGAVAHTTTSDSDTADSDSWDSGLLETGDTYTRTFDKTGTFNYHCTPHPNMTGSIIVE